MQSRRRLGPWQFLTLAISLASLAAAPASVSTYQSLTNALQTSDEISIAANSTINFPAPISINRKVQIDGAAGAALDGRNTNQLFVVTQTGDLSLINLKLQNCRNSPGAGISALGGAIFVAGGGLTVSHCIFSNNSVMGGQAVLLTPDPPLNPWPIFTNAGHAFGGSIAATNALVRVDNCEFLGNSAVGQTSLRFDIFLGGGFAQGGAAQEGAIFAKDSIVQVNNSSFKTNFINVPYGAGGQGGAINAENCAVTISATLFHSNFATPLTWGGWGGALSLSGENIVISDCRFLANLGSPSGGAIYLMGSGLIQRSTFQDNKAYGLSGEQNEPAIDTRGAPGLGGAIAIDSYAGLARIENCVFLNNHSIPGLIYAKPALGGAVAIASDGSLSGSIVHSTFVGNRLEGSSYYEIPQGSAIYAGTKVNVTLAGSVVFAYGTNSSVAGLLTDPGWNVFSAEITNALMATSWENVDPKLLIDTNSYSLVRPAPDSPAINRVATTQLLPADIRGVARPLTGSDSGAVELEGAPALTLARTADQLRLQTSALVPIELFESANLLDWRKLGALPPNSSSEPASYTITNEAPFTFYQAKAGF